MATSKDKTGKHGKSVRPFSRGIALFLGLFALLNVLAALASRCPGLSIWWLDFSDVEELVGRWGRTAILVFEAVGGVLLMGWAIRPGMRLWRRVLTALSALAFAAVADWDAVGFWQGLVAERMTALSPVPLSAVLALAFAAICVRVWTSEKAFGRCGESDPKGVVLSVLVAVACALLFPLLQVATFGLTDYSQQSSCVVVPGARLEADGSLSAVLRERMDTAVELVQTQRASTLIVSGGTEAGGANEADAMAAYASGRLGEDAAGISIVEDKQASSLAASVKTTAVMIEGEDETIVTSSFYQMPRLKMLYLSAGQDVLTAPVVGDLAENGTFDSLWRELGAWWSCWFSTYL